MTAITMGTMPSLASSYDPHPPVSGWQYDGGDAARQLQGLVLAATARIRRVPTGFLIPVPGGEPVICNLNFCPCMEYSALDGMPCVHVYAARAFHQREGGSGGSSIPDAVPPEEHYMYVAPSTDDTLARSKGSSASWEMPLVSHASQPPVVPPRPPNLNAMQMPEPEDVRGIGLHSWTPPHLRYPSDIAKTDLGSLSMAMELPGTAGGDGTAVEKDDVPHPVWRRKQYRDQRLYQQAQMNESRHFRELLLDLASMVPDREQHDLGRKKVPMGSIVYGLAMWVYTQKSMRRAMGEIMRTVDDGLLDQVPSRPMMVRHVNDPAITPILASLIEASASPLRNIETTFAADSTSFASTWKAGDWYEYKHGGNPKGRGKPPRNKWAKAHLISGTMTNIVTAAVVTPEETGDAIKLPELLDATDRNFSIVKLAADKGYISAKNLEAIVGVGAHPYVPLKADAVYRDPARPGADLWNGMMAYCSHYAEEFYSHYHVRSNVETTISSIKRLLGPVVRSQTEDGRVNEVMLKILAYNIITLIHAIYEFGVSPNLGEMPLFNN